MVKQVRFWSQVAAACAAGSLLASLVFTGATWHTPWRQILGVTTSSFVFSFSCAAIGFLTIPRLVPIVWRQLPPPFNWAAVVAALVACATAGSLIPMFLGTWLDLLPARRLFSIGWQSLTGSVHFTP